MRISQTWYEQYDQQVPDAHQIRRSEYLYNTTLLSVLLKHAVVCVLRVTGKLIKLQVYNKTLIAAFENYTLHFVTLLSLDNVSLTCQQDFRLV